MHTCEKTPEYFAWLDLCRFLAAFLVLISHVRTHAFVGYNELEGAHNLFGTGFMTLMGFGNTGVVIFFVLSGFLVGGKLFVNAQKQSFKPSSYILDRTLRIWIPLIPAVLFGTLVSLFLGHAFSATNFIGNMLGLQGIFVSSVPLNPSLWTIAYEIWFYVFALGVGLCLSAKRFTFAGVTIITLSLAMLSALDIRYFLCWLIGAFAYIRRPTVASSRCLIFAIFLCAVGALQIKLGEAGMLASFAIFRVENFRLMLAIGFALLVRQLILMPPRHYFLKKVEKMGAWLATFSYSLYLTHNPLLFLFEYFGLEQMRALNPASLFLYLMVILGALTFAYLVYFVSERNTGTAKAFCRAKLVV